MKETYKDIAKVFFKAKTWKISQTKNSQQLLKTLALDISHSIKKNDYSFNEEEFLEIIKL